MVNDALDVLDPDSRARSRRCSKANLADVGIINIGHDLPEGGFFTRTLRLVMDPNGPTFSPDREHRNS